MRVRLAAFHVDDEADAAGVMLVSWVVQTLWLHHVFFEIRPPGIRQRGEVVLSPTPMQK